MLSQPLAFSLDFILVTALIIVVAAMLYVVELLIRKSILKLKEHVRENKNAESKDK